MIRRLARLALALWAAGSVALAGVLLAQHPFAEPTLESARAALARAVAATATPGFVSTRLAAAVAAEAPLDVALYLELARERGLALPPGLVGEAGAMLAEDQGWLAEAGDCAACAWDIGSCRTLAELGYCALPLEPRRWAT